MRIIKLVLPLMFLLVLIHKKAYTQDREEVLRYLETRSIDNLSVAKAYFDTDKSQIDDWLKENIMTGFKYGINNARRFKELVVYTMDERNVGIFDIGKSRGATTLFMCRLLQNDKEDFRSNKVRHTITIEIRVIDIITGSILANKTFTDHKEYEKSSYGQNPDQKAWGESIAKTTRETVRFIIDQLYPVINNIIDLDEVKGDKVNSVLINDLRYRYQKQPKNLWAYVVKDEVKIAEEKYYIFEKIAELKKPGEFIRNRGAREFEVGKGKKELLKAHSAGQEIYLSTLQYLN